MSWITPVTLNPSADYASPNPVHQRRLFRNPRGLMYYYALSQVWVDDQYHFYKSVDGVTWTKSTFVVDPTVGADGNPSLWIYEDPGESRLIVYIAYWDGTRTITAEAFTIADGGSDPASLWSNTVDTDAGVDRLRTPSICLADDGYLWVAWINLYTSKGKSRSDVRCKCSTSTYPTSAPVWSTETVVFDGSGTNATGFDSIVVVVPLTATADVGIVYKYYVAGVGYVLAAKTGTYAGAGAPSVGAAVILDADTGTAYVFSVVTETGANSDVFVLYQDTDDVALYCRKWDVSAGTSAAFGTVIADNRRGNLSVNRTTETLYAFYEDQVAGKLYFKTSPESGASWSSEYTIDDDSRIIQYVTSSYEDLNDEIFVTYTYFAIGESSPQRWLTTLLVAAYEASARLIGTVIPLYIAQVRTIGSVYRSFSAQVRNIGNVVFSYSSRARLIGTVLLPFTARVRNIGTILIPFSAQIRNIGNVIFPYSSRARLIGTITLPFSTQVRNIGNVVFTYSSSVRNIGLLLLVAVAKCHAELSTKIRRRIF